MKDVCSADFAFNGNNDCSFLPPKTYTYEIIKTRTDKVGQVKIAIDKNFFTAPTNSNTEKISITVKTAKINYINNTKTNHIGSVPNDSILQKILKLNSDTLVKELGILSFFEQVKEDLKKIERA